MTTLPPPVDPRSVPGSNTPALIRELNDDEIIVDWSSGAARSNISSNIVEQNRSEKTMKLADDLLGKSISNNKSFIPPTDDPPSRESDGGNLLPSRK